VGITGKIEEGLEAAVDGQTRVEKGNEKKHYNRRVTNG
jgi:hypothetical protein